MTGPNRPSLSSLRHVCPPPTPSLKQDIGRTYRTNRSTYATFSIEESTAQYRWTTRASRCVCSPQRLDEHPRITDYTGQLSVVVSKIDLDREWWILIDLANIAQLHDPTSEPTHVTRILEIADRVRAPTLLAAAMTFRGHRAIDEDPPNFAVARDCYSRPSTLPVTVAIHSPRVSLYEPSPWPQWGSTPQGDRGMPRGPDLSLRDPVLVPCLDLSEWIALASASTAQPEAAAVVLGLLQTDAAADGFEVDLGYGARSLEIVGTLTKPRRGWRGAAMDRHQIVRQALAAIHSEGTTRQETHQPRLDNAGANAIVTR